MLKMPRQTGAFPPANNLLQKKWNERAYKQHLEKRKAMTTGLNTRKPKSYLHMQLNLKKIQLEEERQEAIDQENRILLAKLTTVIRSAGQLDNWNEEYDDLPKSLNKPHMQREQERIATENSKLTKKLTKVTAEYNLDQWEDEYLLHGYYLSLKAQETKGFEVDTRGFEDDEPHFYNRDREVATANGSVSQFDGGRSETEEQADELSTTTGSTSKPKTTTKTTQSKKAPGPFRRVKPQPRLPLLGQPRKKEEEKRKKELASKPAPYNDKEDAAKLFKTTKEMSRADPVLTKTLARRTYSQRQQTMTTFEKQYELDLEVELIEIMDDEWNEFITTLLAKREMIDATACHQALKGGLPLTDTMIELLCTRNNSALSSIKKTYNKEYSTNLMDDIKSETKGQLRHLFLALAKGTRMESTAVDADRAEHDAEILMGEPDNERWKADSGKMAELFRIASFAQIREVLEHYEQLTESRVQDEFRSTLAGDYRDAMQALVKCLYNCAMYMAERLRISLVRKNSSSLIRLLVTRSEIDMPQIRKAYRQRYGETLMDAIETLCKEPCKKALVSMVLVHGALKNQQDQEEDQKARGAFSATKVPTLPKVAPPKAKPLRRPSPNKAAILKPSNPLMQSIKTQAAKESILVPPRRVVKPKKTVTVVDPRAKQSPPSSGQRSNTSRQSLFKAKRPLPVSSRTSLNSPGKSSVKSAETKGREEKTEEKPTSATRATSGASQKDVVDPETAKSEAASDKTSQGIDNEKDATQEKMIENKDTSNETEDAGIEFTKTNEKELVQTESDGDKTQTIEEDQSDKTAAEPQDKPKAVAASPETNAQVEQSIEPVKPNSPTEKPSQDDNSRATVSQQGAKTKQEKETS
ncbi:uncharacterized protein [Asterias amurensis]|uniref:uncharacterized protein isoform X2 n=1 Tax=Asterias amurensis TaxID=7602 RepID=UPI003AB8B5E7